MDTIHVVREGYGADGPRAALALDLENLLFGFREAGDLEGGLGALGAALADIRRRATVVMSVGVCDKVLAQQVALPLAAHGVRVFPHGGGVDRADLMLIDRLANELPSSCDLVVVGSGDHIFAPAATALRQGGRRVEVLAAPMTLSAELYLACDHHIDLGCYDMVAA